MLTGQTAGSTINPNFTVTDSTGFGLATVDGGGNVLRLTTLNLLPPSGATPTVDYTINNNPGGSASPGSSSLLVTASQTAHSVTVDTTKSSGVLTLNTGVILKSDTWNFGGVGSNTYSIALAANATGAGHGLGDRGRRDQFQQLQHRRAVRSAPRSSTTASPRPSSAAPAPPSSPAPTPMPAAPASLASCNSATAGRPAASSVTSPTTATSPWTAATR